MADALEGFKKKKNAKTARDYVEQLMELQKKLSDLESRCSTQNEEELGLGRQSTAFEEIGPCRSLLELFLLFWRS
eukprot:7663587-Lingulodinium_polyedra.AAC.1